ncbi:MAG TPA: hypothetical protein VF733_04140 [Candidatus Saccharimonadales bacterium]
MTTERFNQRPCPPEVRGFVSRMEELMREPQYNHAGIPAQVAIDLQRAGYVASFAHFETCLREMGSRVHFLAVPLDFYGEQYTTTYPLGREDQPEYTLYAAVNGAEEAAQMLERLGITAEENVARLENAGVLTLPQGQ